MFERSKYNPILKPNPTNSWEESKLYNPAVIYEKELYHLFYRAMGKNWVSSIGYAVSEDGENFKRFSEPILIFWPQEPYELRGIVDILPGGYKVMEKMSHEELEQFLNKHEAKGGMPQVTFCCGATAVDGMLKIYYGASDSVICAATVKLEDVLNQVKVE